MEKQKSLFPKTIEERFQEFHRANPAVFQLFEMYARLALNSGKRLGSRAIMERVRWEVYMKTRDGEGFKINNNFTSRYARLLVEKHPEFDGFFEMRDLRAA